VSEWLRLHVPMAHLNHSFKEYDVSSQSRWRGAFRRHRLEVFLLLPLLAAGCASYERRPLAREEFARQLTDRSPASVLAPDSVTKPIGEEGLTLAEARMIALFYNPALRAARLKAQVPVLSATKAGLWEDPELSFDGLRILKSVEKPWIVGSSLAFTLPLSGRLHVEKAKAHAEGRAALVEAWAVEQDIIRQLEVEWADRTGARRALEALVSAQQELGEVVAITKRLEDAGELIAAEAIAFQVAESRAVVERQRLARNVSESEARIVALLGLVPGTPIPLKTGEAPSQIVTIPDRAALLERNPSVALREAEYEVVEESLRLEVRRQYPDLTIGPAYGNEDGESRFGLGFSLPLPVFNGNRRAIVEATARRNAARSAWEESVHGAITELSRLELRLAALEEQRAQLKSGVAALSESQLVAARRLADQGEVNALLLLEALRIHLEVTLEQIEVDTERDRLRAAIRAIAPEDPFTPPTDAKGTAK